MTDVATRDEPPAPPPVRRGLHVRGRPVDVKLLLASLGIAVGVALIGFALLTARDGTETELPVGVEALSPAPDAPQALAQTQVIADLEEGFTGELTIDGSLLETVSLDDLGVRADVEPGAQIEIDIPPGAAVFEPGNDTLTFTPCAGTTVSSAGRARCSSAVADIERFESGRHQVTVTYWPIEEGRSAARSYVWYFTTV